MKSEAVSFPSVTLCNFRNLDFDVLNRIIELSLSGGPPVDNPPAQQDYGTVEDLADYAASDQDNQNADYVDHHYNPTDKFIFEYLTFVANLTNIINSDRYLTDRQVRHAIRVNNTLFKRVPTIGEIL